nr:MAG TPA: hypothetical protein [Bacteriophage sp.]
MIVNYPRMRRRAAWPNDLDTALQFASPNPFSISAPKNWDGKIEYTNGSEWETWNGSAITSGKIGSNHCIYLRGIGNSKITGVNSFSAKWSIVGTNIACNGDIDRLLDYSTVKSGNRPAMVDSCYRFMFYGCTSLTTAPSLPATTLAGYCYGFMFRGCTSLTTAPSLPATTLTDNCYSSMFYGCKSLTTAPSLPATTLAYGCYSSMFRDCKKIKLSTTASGTYTKAYRIPKSGTGEISSQSLDNMFANTGGTFTGTPTINTTYYLDESNTIV